MTVCVSLSHSKAFVFTCQCRLGCCHFDWRPLKLTDRQTNTRSVKNINGPKWATYNIFGSWLFFSLLQTLTYDQLASRSVVREDASRWQQGAERSDRHQTKKKKKSKKKEKTLRRTNGVTTARVTSHWGPNFFSSSMPIYYRLLSVCLLVRVGTTLCLLDAVECGRRLLLDES